ncbi:NADH-quinone oxidoreductase subunit C [Streptomyces sp. XD-27]|uniref:NADH-quinone oxidoreductase subunit C n=1 Tax=Streptomyces sp. XD-27 TaxID=3062779 RepID=UPI0026F4570D|nr:NADH-quinone oxidoreductase subunit C [Streptomyces sp. XD-27]WKX71962.1 NADH-quinone oxidoreductase subunit C [Streptomyces sp. XD-27]
MSAPEERPEGTARAATEPDAGAAAAQPDGAAGAAAPDADGAVAAPPAVGWLPAPAEEIFGEGATAEESYDLLTVDVPPSAWITALEAARDGLGCTYFDWLSAVDEPGTGFRVAAHVVALVEPGPGAAAGRAAVRRLLVRTTVPHDAPALPTATGVYAGAAWHERETYEMFGVAFTDHPHLVPLLLPEGFEGHPLRKDFVLAARVAKAWPGAKEPGESDHGGPKRRQMLPPGVPDPNEWGPLKGQLPPAPARPARAARGPRAAGAAGAAGPAAAGERPVRRARSASAGSASQRAEADGAATAAPEAAAAGAAAAGAGAGAGAPAAPRRARSASEGSTSQRAGAERPARRARSASEGSAGQRAEGTATAPEAVAPESAPDTTPTESAPDTTPPESAAPDAGAAAAETAGTAVPRGAGEGPVGQAADAGARRPAAPRTRSSDAPWHHARPAFDEGEPKPEAKDAPPADEAKPTEASGTGGDTAASGPAEASDTAEATGPGTGDSAATDDAAETSRTPGDAAGGTTGTDHDTTRTHDGGDT